MACVHPPWCVLCIPRNIPSFFITVSHTQYPLEQFARFVWWLEAKIREAEEIRDLG